MKSVKEYLVIILVCLCIQTGWSQHTYRLRYAVDIPLTTIGLGTLTSSFFLGKKQECISEEEVSKLNRNEIWKFDRSATDRWSPGSAKASDALMYSVIAMPALLLINRNVRNEGYSGIIYAQALLLNAGLTNLTKVLAKRKRCYVYNEKARDYPLTKDASRSFFSGHTSFTATSSFFMAKVFADLNPDSNLKPLMWSTGAILPAIVGILRYTGGKHYFTDIIVGYLVGAAVGILVPHFHKIGHTGP